MTGWRLRSIQIAPDILAMIFRAGATILTNNGYRITLAEGGVQALLVEGGSRIHGAFISACRVDSVAFFLAPRLVGAGRPIVEGAGLDWRTPLRLGPLDVRAIGEDILVEADVLGPKLRRRS